MKKMLIFVGAFAMISTTYSCAKCYVCVNKNQDEFAKVEYCDKDFDRGDVRERIEDAENSGATCHAKSRAF